MRSLFYVDLNNARLVGKNKIIWRPPPRIITLVDCGGVNQFVGYRLTLNRSVGLNDPLFSGFPTEPIIPKHNPNRDRFHNIMLLSSNRGNSSKLETEAHNLMNFFVRKCSLPDDYRLKY